MTLDSHKPVGDYSVKSGFHVGAALSLSKVRKAVSKHN
jgi:hypothetical protein